MKTCLAYLPVQVYAVKIVLVYEGHQIVGELLPLRWVRSNRRENLLRCSGSEKHQPPIEMNTSKAEALDFKGRTFVVCEKRSAGASEVIVVISSKVGSKEANAKFI